MCVACCLSLCSFSSSSIVCVLCVLLLRVWLWLFHAGCCRLATGLLNERTGQARRGARCPLRSGCCDDDALMYVQHSLLQWVWLYSTVCECMVMGRFGSRLGHPPTLHTLAAFRCWLWCCVVLCCHTNQHAHTPAFMHHRNPHRLNKLVLLARALGACTVLPASALAETLSECEVFSCVVLICGYYCD